LYDIISLALDFVAIGISIYALFKDSNSKDTEKSPQIKVLKQVVLVQQINPNYNIHNGFNVPNDYSERIAQNEDEIKNANWVSKRLFQLAGILIYVSLGINFISYLNTSQGIDSITSLTAMIYLPIRNTLLQLSLCLVAFCIVVILRGWDKSQSKRSNLWGMKYYFLKMMLEILNVISFSFISYTFIEKLNTNIQHPIYSWVFLHQQFYL